ncbi:cell wall metabolism sensor histidine kinase WalK [uncultured Microbacterium sp.]|uniref:sensor histidine kinase n=1 Tax=uncultured Microbacterium sp. TaxID=191216 RepID=UPI0026204A51|nr:PAS domain-containing sensor histidine kinase [uncultured Microbacterium sp.]
MTTAPPSPSGWSQTRSRSLWRWQLILTATVVTLVGTTAVLEPARFGQVTFVIGAIGVIGLTCVALAFPWHRVSRRDVALLPLADIVAIGLLTAGSAGTSLRFLWVFPVAWIATYYTLPWIIGAVGVVAACMVAEAASSPLTAAVAQPFLTVLLALGFIGITMNIGAGRTRAYAHLLRRQVSQLDRTRERAVVQVERTAQLSDALETGLASVDRDGVLVLANAAFLRLYAAESAASFTPTTAVEYDERRGRALGPSETAFARAARGERFNDRRVWLFTAAGRWHALDVSSRPVDTIPGESPSNLLVIHDVTSVVDAARERRTVTTVVSHELRNPLTAILGHTELLQDREDLPPDIRRQLSVIDNAAQRMQRLVTSTLSEFTDVVDNDPAPVDIGRMIEASVQAFSPVAASSLVTITHIAGDTPPVKGDAFRLRQAIDNVIGNAVKYTTRGGTVRVSAESDGASLVVTVADTGIGMSQLDLARVFDPGFRSDTARASGIGGTGLGMAITHEIVVQHGGTIEVRSELGRGTSVVLTLPRADKETP